MSQTVSRLHRRRMGEIMVSEGLISGEQLDQALAQQRLTGDRLGRILIDMGLITETDITKTLSAQYQVPFLTLVNYESETKLVGQFPPTFLHEHQILPFDEVGNTLLVLVGEIPAVEVLEEVGKTSSKNVALYVGYPTEVANELTKLIPLPEDQLPKRKKPAPKGASVPEIEIVSPDRDDEDSDGASSGSAAVNPMLFGGSSENIMEQLDSTWDSIFQEVGDRDDDDDDD